MLYSMALGDCFKFQFWCATTPGCNDISDGRITDNIHKSNSIKFSNIYWMKLHSIYSISSNGDRFILVSLLPDSSSQTA